MEYFFSRHGGFCTDVDVLKMLEKISRTIANEKNARLFRREINILRGHDTAENYDRPTVDVLCSEDKRNEIKRHGSPGDGYLDYLIKFDHKFDDNRDLFCDLAPEPGDAVLDVGSGAGFLTYILKRNGVDVVEALDMPEPSGVFNNSCRILGVEKKEFTIEKRKPMMSFGRKFDIIACGLLQFDGHSLAAIAHGKGEGGGEFEWGTTDWLCFLKDMHDNLLTDDGYIWLGFTETWLGTTVIDANKEQAAAIREMFEPYLVKDKRSSGEPVKLSRRDIAGLLTDRESRQEG
ncbi:MAG: hypothetical protein O3A85_01185 [Proteobacteria bacterium]|nr:hypothetical protein [Pseudomonadota bacterium]